jgi:hypothetical protein
MADLIVSPEGHDLIEHLHSDIGEMPKPFEEDIFLLGINVAGPNHVPNIKELFDYIQEGDRVRLVREPENEYDEYAIRIDVIEDKSRKADARDGKLALGGVKLGYVPQYQNKPFARLMDSGKLLYGVVRLKEMNGDYPKIVIKIYMKDDVFSAAGTE